MATKTGPSLGTIQQDEHDHISYAKRVVLVSKNGNTVSYEDTNFITGDSPAVLNVFSDIGEKGDGGYFINDGEGDMKIEISNDGTSYGGQHTIKSGETLDLKGISINKIRITWVSNSSYRVLVGPGAILNSLQSIKIKETVPTDALNNNPSYVLAYDVDGLLTTLTKTISGVQYQKTLSYTSNSLTGVSVWVQL